MAFNAKKAELELSMPLRFEGLPRRLYEQARLNETGGRSPDGGTSSRSASSLGDGIAHGERVLAVGLSEKPSAHGLRALTRF